MNESVINNIRELERSMRVSVKIPRDKVDRVVVTTLISVRNSCVNSNNDMSHFDKVIKHYLTEDEFRKYVIDKVEIDY